MRCPFCGNQFQEEEGHALCNSCSMSFGYSCKMIKCPRCGYETPDSKLLKTLKRWGEKRRK